MNFSNVDTVTPGAGEYITRCALARSIGEAFFAAGDDADTHDILYRIIINQFYGNLHYSYQYLKLTARRTHLCERGATSKCGRVASDAGAGG